MASSRSTSDGARTREADPAADLLSLLQEIHATLDPEALLKAIPRHLRRLADYRALRVYLPRPDGTLTPALTEGGEPASSLSPDTGLARAAALRREPLVVPRPGAEAAEDGRSAQAMALPLLHGDRLVAVVEVEAAGAGLTAEAQGALKAVSGHLAVAMGNAARHSETRWHAGLLGILYEIGKEMASILELDELLQRVAEVVKRVVDYEMFGILLTDPESGDLVLRKSVSYGALTGKTRIRPGEGLCGAAAAAKQPVLVQDVTRDDRYLNLIPQTRSELAVPLVYKDRLVGVLDLESSVVARFTDEHVRVLMPLASQVAVAVENARLYQEHVRREERLENELAIARRVQHGLFPEESPSGPGWKASAQFVPARELGGDLYDFYDIGEGLLGVAVGDVAGKGVPAALYGAFASGTIRARAFQRLRPGELLWRANRTLRRRGVEGLFCTLTFALFEFGARQVTLANSGLPYPLRYEAASGRCQPIEMPGVPLGVLDDTRYEEQSFVLRPGDVFLFHTDGVTEASRDGQEYGTARLRALVEQHARLDVGELAARISADVNRFLGAAGPADDITFVAVKIL